MLVRQISQLREIEPQVFSEMQREILDIDLTWTQVYSEYQSGGWKTLSLINPSANPQDTLIHDGDAVETTLLLKMPQTRRFLSSLGLKIMWARLARLEANGFMWEHRDYAELNNVERLRLHVPIITNPRAALIIDGKRVHMTAGRIWKLDPTERHAACNLGHESRIHILIDAYGNEDLDNLIKGESLCSSRVQNLPVACVDTLSRHMAMSSRLAQLGYRASAENLLLKLFHTYDLPEGVSYDLVSQMYQSLGDEDSRQNWNNKKHKFLGLKNNENLHTHRAPARKSS